jgi:UDP-N-acetylmuramoyl-L-alanyl-D-glutamate--2,6-diaminopimelate ligase
MRSIGVTGTNGKTTTTTWLAAALAVLGRPVFRSTTLGYYLEGDRVDAGTGYAGFVEAAQKAAERGARFGAIELTSHALWGGIARAWPCEVGVFTHLSTDHLDAHGDVEHYLASKAQLFMALPAGGCAVLNGCDHTFELLREVVPSHARVMTYGHESRGRAATKLDLEVVDACFSWSGTTFTTRGDAFGTKTLHVAGIGEVFAENAAAALLGACAMGASFDEAGDRITGAAPPPGRFEVVAVHPHVVVDYAHTPDALARTCRTARALSKNGNGAVVIVFGAGGGRDPKKRPAMGAAVRDADRVVLTTDNPRHEDPRAIIAAVAEGLTRHARLDVEVDRSAAITRAVREAGADDIVLVCGKGHETEQIVGALAQPFSDKAVAVLAHASRS